MSSAFVAQASATALKAILRLETACRHRKANSASVHKIDLDILPSRFCYHGVWICVVVVPPPLFVERIDAPMILCVCVCVCPLSMHVRHT